MKIYELLTPISQFLFEFIENYPQKNMYLSLIFGFLCSILLKNAIFEL